MTKKFLGIILLISVASCYYMDSGAQFLPSRGPIQSSQLDAPIQPVFVDGYISELAPVGVPQDLDSAPEIPISHNLNANQIGQQGVNTQSEQTRVWASRGEEHVTEEYTDESGIVHQLHRWIDSLGLRHEADCWIDENQNEIEIDKWEDGDGCVDELHRATAPDGQVEEVHYRKDQHGVISEVESNHDLYQEGTQP